MIIRINRKRCSAFVGYSYDRDIMIGSKKYFSRYA
jgi:hypothetical protein